MAIVSSIFIVAASFVCFALISYALVRFTFPKVENDDWEEKYLEIKREAKKLTEARKRAYSFKGGNVLG